MLGIFGGTMRVGLRMRGAGLLALLLGIAGAGRAQAQDAAPAFDAAKEMVGTWEMSNADRDRRCTMTFSTDAVPGGLKLVLDQGCATVFPMLKDVVVWNIAPSGPLRLLDAKGNAALDLT